MTRLLKINRARRNLLKAVGTAATVIVGASAPAKAQWGGWGGGGSGAGSGSVACFVRGTQVLTADGYRAIETLAAGDNVATRFSGFAPIKSVNNFTLNRVRGEWAGPSRPVRIKRNALGENMPASDLCLTASHAIAVEGMLVPVGNLINGTSIVFEAAEGHQSLQFFHIELDRHDVLDIQGAGCESRRPPSVEPCLPLAGFHGHRSEIESRLRSALSVVVDRRQPLDIVRDRLEERGIALAA